MLLDGRYELMALLSTEAGALFEVRDHASGRLLLLRFVRQGEAAAAAGREGVLLASDAPPAHVITENTAAWREWRPAAPPNPAAPAGEFTRMFQATAEPLPAPIPVATPGPAAPAEGDFTRFFRQPMAANPQALESLPASEPEAPAGKPFSEPGEFTKFFDGAPAAAAPPAAEAGEATALFGQGTAPPAPSGAHGASEYTQFLKAAREQPPAPSAPVPALPPAASAARAGMPAWLTGLIAALAIGVVILVAIFAFR